MHNPPDSPACCQVTCLACSDLSVTCLACSDWPVWAYGTFDWIWCVSVCVTGLWVCGIWLMWYSCSYKHDPGSGKDYCKPHTLIIWYSQVRFLACWLQRYLSTCLSTLHIAHTEMSILMGLLLYFLMISLIISLIISFLISYTIPWWYS